jgi:hypothetical protein
VSRATRAAALLGLVAAAGLLGGCATCRGGSPVVVQPQVGGSIGSSGGGSWSTGGVGLDLSNLFCRPPDPATEPHPGPGSPPITDGPARPAKPADLPPGAAPL